jgi:hypothetical protein
MESFLVESRRSRAELDVECGVGSIKKKRRHLIPRKIETKERTKPTHMSNQNQLKKH